VQWHNKEDRMMEVNWTAHDAGLGVHQRTLQQYLKGAFKQKF